MSTGLPHLDPPTAGAVVALLDRALELCDNDHRLAFALGMGFALASMRAPVVPPFDPRREPEDNGTPLARVALTSRPPPAR